MGVHSKIITPRFCSNKSFDYILKLPIISEDPDPKVLAHDYKKTF